VPLKADSRGGTGQSAVALQLKQHREHCVDTALTKDFA
jgi:hypothetical protein